MLTMDNIFAIDLPKKEKRFNNIKKIRLGAGYTRLRLATEVEPPTSVDMIVKLEKGERSLTQDWMERISAVLGCRATDLIAAGQPKVDIIGYLVNGMVDLRNNLEQIDRPVDLGPEECDAVITVADDSASPYYWTHDTIYLSKKSELVQPFLGKVCFIKLKGGQATIRRLVAGSRPGTYTLKPVDPEVQVPVMRDVEVEYVRKITGSKHA